MRTMSAISGPQPLAPVSRALTLVPRCSLSGFLGRGRMETHRVRQARLMRARIRRQNSARSMSFAVPASISAIRRRTSAFQASSTPESGVPSKLVTICRTSSARSGSDSFRISARSLSKVVLPMLRAPYCDETIVNSKAYGGTNCFPLVLNLRDGHYIGHLMHPGC